MSDAIASVRDEGIAATLMPSENAPPADFLVAAYPASAHLNSAVASHLARLCQRQALSAGTRLAAAACGNSDRKVTETDVQALLCRDGIVIGRHVARLGSPPDLFEEARLWLIAAARARHAAGADLASNASLSPNALIEQNAEAQQTWLGSY